MRKLRAALARLHTAAGPGNGDKPPMRFRNALGASFATAIFLTAAIATTELAVLRFPHLQNQKVITTDQLTQLIKNALAIVAGAGALIALVTTYRRQKTTERAEIREQDAHTREQTRIHNERFTTAASQLADPNPAIRIAGIYAMAGLADDWETQRQTCIDVLCANLRIPYLLQPPNDAPPTDQATWRANREARHTLIRIITAHLQPSDKRAPAHTSWSNNNLDFTGVNFDGGDFSGAIFSGTTSFAGAQFTSGITSFADAQFTNGTVNFSGAQFTGGRTYFFSSQFSGSTASFTHAQFTGGSVYFGDTKFIRGTIDFAAAEFSGGTVSFTNVKFAGSTIRFRSEFTASGVDFNRAQFSGGEVSFRGANFTGGSVSFGSAHFTGSIVELVDSHFEGGTVDFRKPRNWSTPPRFSLTCEPPPGLHLPPTESIS